MSFVNALSQIPDSAIPSEYKPYSDMGADGGKIVTSPREVVDGKETDVTQLDTDRVLEENGFSSEQWTVVSARKGKWQAGSRNLESFKLNVVPKVKPVEETGFVLPDWKDLEDSVERIRKARVPRPYYAKTNTTVVGVLSDLQVGKVDSRGNTDDLLVRVDDSLTAWKAYLKKVRPSEIILCDAGDPIENFENTSAQARTNDLSLTQQIRLWRRIFWQWVETAASLAPSVQVAVVGSNHGRVRRGKDVLGTPHDDYGIEVSYQIEDMTNVNPDLYSHVNFHRPDEYQESLSVQAVGGKVVGLVHGHQVTKADRLSDWWAGQSHGRLPVGQADILIAGHFHNFRVETSGNDRWLFIAPTSDNGSGWFRNMSGHESAPGVLSFTLTESGWGDLVLC
jgi:hypothetical protein